MKSVAKVSIVVPVYNVEMYIRQCVDSILAQTFIDWELLLVNDGTLDNSGIICDEYAQKDSRIRVFHKENGGVSSARNLGIENARGEWITFIDADDFVGEDYLARIYEVVEKNPLIDFIHCGCQNYQNGIISINQHYEDIESNDASLLFNKFRGLVVSKLFRRSIINTHDVKFDEAMKIGEDYVFTLNYMLHVNTYALNSCIDYYYRIHPGSVTHKVRDCGSYNTALNEFRSHYKSVMTYIDAKRISKKESEYRLSLLANNMINTMLTLFRGNMDTVEIKDRLCSDFDAQQLCLFDKAKGSKNLIKKFLLKNRLYFVIKILVGVKN